MEGMTIIDGVSILILAVSALLAYSRGFVREILSILGWIVAAVVAFIFAGQVEPLVREIPVVGDMIGSSCELSILAAFALVFAVALIVVSIFTPLVSGAVQNSAVGSLDQGMGFLFGLARGALLIIIALIVYERLIAGGEGFPMVDDSKTAEIFAQTKERIAEQVPENAPGWIAERYAQLNASGSCGPAEGSAVPEATTPEAAPAEEAPADGADSE
jgi:membrane protein required for colicin V production